MEEERVENFNREKEKMIKTRSNINAESQLQTFMVKEKLFNMAVTKKWDPKEIEVILEKNSPEGKSRTVKTPQEIKLCETTLSR